STGRSGGLAAANETSATDHRTTADNKPPRQNQRDMTNPSVRERLTDTSTQRQQVQVHLHLLALRARDGAKNSTEMVQRCCVPAQSSLCVQPQRVARLGTAACIVGLRRRCRTIAGGTLMKTRSRRTW